MKIALFACIIAALPLINLNIKGQYYDSTSESEVASYLSLVARSGAFKTMPGFSRIDAFMLARTLGEIDRKTLSPFAFAEHLQESEEVRNRFYPDLDAINFRMYLPPLRISEENCLSSGWRKSLRMQVEPLIKGLSNPREAAPVILAWCKMKVNDLDGDNCYPLRLKDDLDPLTTLRIASAPDADITILAAAALRSVGIVARLVTAPVISGTAGGKCWVEYRAGGKWIPWTASAPSGMDSLSNLLKLMEGGLTLVLANPDVPVNVTSEYSAIAHVSVTFSNIDGKDSPGWNLLCQGSDQLRPVTGRNIYLHPSDTLDICPGSYLLVAGNRNHISALKPITLSVGQTASYVLNLAGKGNQSLQMTDGTATDMADSQEIHPFNSDVTMEPGIW